jgi:1-acyl-sn-glycerol-3-phosphate acyltransferase
MEVQHSTRDHEAPRRGRSAARAGRLDRAITDPFQRLFGPIGRAMWPSDVRGLEHLPDHDRYVVIANHSGLGPAELLSMLLWWTERFGDDKPLAGMAHPAAFHVPHLRPVLHAYGAVEATREGAAWARSQGVPLLLFPGGDREAMRPFYRANRVDLQGRKGWIRLARELDLAVVPLCISNSHLTMPMIPAPPKLVAWLTGARLLGIKRAPLPVHSLLIGGLVHRALRKRGLSHLPAGLASLASMWLSIAVPPLPARIGFDFHAPIPRAELDASDDHVYARVEGLLQATMDERRR